MAADFNLINLLNNKSKAAAEEPKNEESTNNAFEIVMLDIEDLIPSKDNFYSTENINELATSIELSGIEQNLIVKPEAHGKYEIIAGHRRRLATLKLVNRGKEEHRKVPCRIKYETDDIKDKLSLILTNSTTRELSDWEKIEQSKQLKELLIQYKKILSEENKNKPKEEKERLGRIREIVAQMLNISTTQVGRMETIDNNLSKEFKEELKQGNINISTAHELSRLDEEKQKEAYEKYEQKGELHIKDIKEEPKESIAIITKEKNAKHGDTLKKQKEATNEPNRDVEDENENGKMAAEYEKDDLAGQINIIDYKELPPEVKDKGLDFTSWLAKRYGIGQYKLIKKVVRDVLIKETEKNNINEINLTDLEDKLTNSVSIWLLDKATEYQKYIKANEYIQTQ